MAFRTLLLCVLVSYVAVIAASPIESEKVEVENVESSTKDDSLTDLEDISIEGEVIDPDSEEHPESAGLFGVGKRIKKGFEKMSSGVRSMKNKVIDKVNILKRPGKKSNTDSLHTVSHKPNKDRNRKNPRTSNRRDNARGSSARGSNKPRKPVRQTKPAKKGEPGFVAQLGTGMLVSGAAAFSEGVGASIVPHAGDLVGSFINKVKNIGDTSDDDACKQQAIDHCFDKAKSSDSKKCMEDYKCSKN